VHTKKAINGEPIFDKRKLNTGRPPKVSAQDQRSTRRTIPRLRQSKGTFTSKRLKLKSGLHHISNRTFRRHLNHRGFNYLQSRKKGRIIKKDLQKRLQFCRNLDLHWVAKGRKTRRSKLHGCYFPHKRSHHVEAVFRCNNRWKVCKNNTN